jgi:hypothetical protein
MGKAKAASDGSGKKKEVSPNGGLRIPDLTQRREGAARPAATEEFEQEQTEKTEAEKLCQKCATFRYCTAEAQRLGMPCVLASLRLCVGFFMPFASPHAVLRRPGEGGRLAKLDGLFCAFLPRKLSGLTAFSRQINGNASP